MENKKTLQQILRISKKHSEELSELSFEIFTKYDSCDKKIRALAKILKNDKFTDVEKAWIIYKNGGFTERAKTMNGLFGALVKN